MNPSKNVSPKIPAAGDGAARNAVRRFRDKARAEREVARAEEHKTGALLHGRRAFVRGAGGLSLALPFLQAFQPRKAHAAPQKPKRFLLWHQGQGTQYDQWAKAGASPTDITFGKILKPVEAYKDRMLFLQGIDNKISDLASGNGHQTKQTTCLTCQPDGAGPSFDQVLSERIREPGQRSSLNLAAGSTKRVRLYAGPGDKIESQGDPRRVLDSLFTNTSGESEAELAKIKMRRESILDAVRDNFKLFEKRLGKEDKIRVEQHTDKLRELEVRLEQQQRVSCQKPEVSVPGGFNPFVNQAESAEIQIEIIVMAFACNLTPVATLEWTDDHNPPMFGGFSRGYGNWHEMVHSGETRRGIGGLHSGYAWYAERFATLMDRLSKVDEGGVPLMDTTAVQWTCDFGYGSGHNGRQVHTILAGSLGSNVQMGRMVSFADPEKLWARNDWALNNLYVTLLQAFGQDDNTFGNPGAGVRPGAIPGVLS